MLSLLQADSTWHLVALLWALCPSGRLEQGPASLHRAVPAGALRGSHFRGVVLIQCEMSAEVQFPPGALYFWIKNHGFLFSQLILGLQFFVKYLIC